MVSRRLLLARRLLSLRASPLPRFSSPAALRSPLCSLNTDLCSYRPLKFSVSRILFFSTHIPHLDDAQGPAAVDYRSLMPEGEFHRLADDAIHDLQEKLEEYGDTIQIDGFDIDYGNEVLTIRLGSIGTYVINKQTPNRQIWLSSPVSGPSRFDWDASSKTWVYRRTKANLLQLLEEEIGRLCGKPIELR